MFSFGLPVVLNPMLVDGGGEVLLEKRRGGGEVLLEERRFWIRGEVLFELEFFEIKLEERRF